MELQSVVGTSCASPEWTIHIVPDRYLIYLQIISLQRIVYKVVVVVEFCIYLDWPFKHEPVMYMKPLSCPLTVIYPLYKSELLHLRLRSSFAGAHIIFAPALRSAATVCAHLYR
jgi:hypothetical protein